MTLIKNYNNNTTAATRYRQLHLILGICCIAVKDWTFFWGGCKSLHISNHICLNLITLTQTSP